MKTSAEATTSNAASPNGMAPSPRPGSAAGQMLAHVCDLLGRGIDAGERCGRAASQDQFAERAGAAADIEPARVAGASSQARNLSPTARLQRPMKRS